MKLTLSRGKYALVDDEDYKYLNQWKWSILKAHNNNHYAFRRIYFQKGEKGYRMGKVRKSIYLHRFIMNASKSKQVDHVNGDGLDCRKKNLRTVTNIQNSYNQSVRKDNRSGYKGVKMTIAISHARPNSTINKKIKKPILWRAQITAKKVRYYLGAFSSGQEAAKAYDEAAKRLHGRFARLNFPQNTNDV